MNIKDELLAKKTAQQQQTLEEQVNLNKIRNETDRKLLKMLSRDELQDDNIKAFVDNGYVPIVSARFVDTDRTNILKKEKKPYIQSAQIGKGAQGKVYEVSKNGKRYAGKIANDFEEAKIRKAIEDKRELLSSKAKKHIVKTYAIKPVQIRNTRYWLIIMEILEPLNSFETDAYLKGQMGLKYGLSKSEHDLQNMSPEDYNKENLLVSFKMSLQEMITQSHTTTDILSILEVNKKEFEEILIAIFQNNLKDIISKTEQMFINNEQASRMIKEILPNILDDVVEVFKLSKIKQDHFTEVFNFVREVLYDTYHFLPRVIKNSFRPETTHSDEYERQYNIIKHKMIKQQRDLVDSLIELKNNGIVWGDLHVNNVMKRQKTGELVAVDVGLFDLK